MGCVGNVYSYEVAWRIFFFLRAMECYVKTSLPPDAEAVMLGRLARYILTPHHLALVSWD